MRIQNIELQAFAKFTEFSLDLQGPGLQIIYGPNEAGKSTLQRALVQLLFGIPERSRDDFLHPKSKLRLAATLLDDEGTEHRIIRRKGRQNTLLNGDDTPLDEAVLQRILGNISESEYRTMFALSRQSLEAGARDMLSGKGELGASLFEASAGLTGLGRLLDALGEEARTIYRDRGEQYPLNRALRGIEAARKTCAAASLSGDDWKAAQDKLALHEQECSALKEERRGLELRLKGLHGLQQARPLLSELDVLDLKLEELQGTVELAEDAAEQRIKLSLGLKEADLAVARSEEEIKRDQKALKELSLDRRYLESADAIESLYQETAAYRENAERFLVEERSHKEIEEKLAQLSTGLCLEVLDTLPQVKEVLGRLKEQSIALETEERSLRTAEVRLSRDSGQAKLDLDSLSEGQLALREARRVLPLEVQVTELKLALAEQQRAVEEALQGLSAWNKPCTEWLEISLPNTATLTALKESWRDLEAQGQEHGKEERRLKRRRTQVEGLQRALTSSSKLYTEQDLREHRSTRDASWTEVRQAALGEQALGEPTVLSYEAALIKADLCVDALRQDAERVAEWEGLARQLAEIDAEAAVLEADRLLLEQDWCTLRAKWQLAWSDCAILEPKAPEAMELLLERLPSLHAAAREKARLEARQAELKAQCSEVTEHLANAMELDELWQYSLESLVHKASDWIGALQSQEAEAKSRAAQLRELEQRRAEYSLSHDSWIQECHDLAKSLGLDPEISLSQVTAKLQKLSDYQTLLEQASQSLKRCSDLRSALERYDQAVSALGLEGDVLLWQRRLRDEREKDVRRRTLEERLEVLERELLLQEGKRAELAGAVDLLVKEGGAKSLEELPELERRAQALRTLRDQHSQYQSQLLAAASGRTLAELRHESREWTAEGLAQSLGALEEERELLDGRITELDQDIGEQRRQLFSMEQDAKSASAADAALDRACQEAEVRRLGRRYAQLEAASQMMRLALERYRERHQGPVLERASELFHSMTCGSFAGLKMAYGQSDSLVIVGERDDGMELAVDAMSSGSAEQLFLSLRLASIEHFVDQHRPLPVFLDDTLLDSDEERSRQVLRALGDLAKKTQVIMFSHHAQHLKMAAEVLGGEPAIITLER